MSGKNIFHNSNFILSTFIALAILMISSALIELHQSKKELFLLMEGQSHTLLESIIIASQNSLLSNEYLEESTQKRLLNNAYMIKNLYEEGKVTNEVLEKISKQNDIYRINIFNSSKQKIFTNYQRSIKNTRNTPLPVERLNPIFDGLSDTLIIGYREARARAGYRYAVAVATEDKGAIVLNIDAQQYLDFKKNTGFGALINKVALENSQIEYIALQDSFDILAATGYVKSLESIQASSFLTESITDSVFLSRIIDTDSLQLFEIVHPFTFKEETIGLIRIGLSMAPIQDINKRIFRRLIIITVVLITIGLLMFTLIFIRQRLSFLQKRYEIVDTYSSNIIESVSEVIIVFDKAGDIKIFNNAAEILFKKKKQEALETSIEKLFTEEQCKNLFEKKDAFHQLNCTINDQKKYLLVSRSIFHDSDKLEYTILVIKDLTEQKLLEEQFERKQRLTAMGELASGVAHEIRNPLNAIGTIIQQLKKDFKPGSDTEEYNELTDIVYSEVRRINDTIQDFLRFARPEPIQASEFSITELFDQLSKQYQSLLDEKKISLSVAINWTGEVFWDQNQIKQALINIIQNAIEAIDKNGKINIELSSVNKKDLEIKITDDGPGMDEKIKENIFNLYYTTKAKGTGIGLSLVQRIIYEHGGVIIVESELEKGTSFIIKLSKRFKG